jgi:hypothetical protein
MTLLAIDVLTEMPASPRPRRVDDVASATRRFDPRELSERSRHATTL